MTTDPNAAVENPELTRQLAALGLPHGPELVGQLQRYLSELLRWNQKVNLTAITDRAEGLEKHLVDSLAILPEVQAVCSAAGDTVLDLGSGPGLPGIPLSLALPGLRATMVDSVQKKVGFIKHAIVTFGLVGRAKGVAVTAEGEPQAEGLPLVKLVVARAFTEPAGLLDLARHYLEPNGAVLVMLGRHPAPGAMAAVGEAAGYGLVSERAYTLPASKSERAVALFRLK